MLPGSSVHGLLQARTLEWLPCPPSGDIPDPGIEPRSPTLQADIMTRTYHYNIRQHIFTAIEILCAAPWGVVHHPFLTSSWAPQFLWILGTHTLHVRTQNLLSAGGTSVVLSVLAPTPSHRLSQKRVGNWMHLWDVCNQRGARFSTCVSMDFSYHFLG